MTTLSIADLKVAIEALFGDHPDIEPAPSRTPASRGVHLKVYRTKGGQLIGHESDRSTMQGIWVHRDSVRLDRLSDIKHELKTELDLERARLAGTIGRNSNLEAVDGFKGEALIHFNTKTISDVMRIVGEITA